MEPSGHRRPAGLHAIARPSGALAMVAIDQRDSLRSMFQARQSEPVPDDLVADFKIAVAETLGGTASAMLFDRHFGFPALRLARAKHPACGRVLAADRLIQVPGLPVTDTDIDADVDPAMARQEGVVALKLLLLWKGRENAVRCGGLAKTFMERCRANGLVGIVEAMVRPPDNGGASDNWDREQAILEAAEALADSRPDLYKGEVPFRGRAQPDAIRARCEQISAALACPWVVLSQGVEASDFPAAVRAACLGGASGFLAGRAIWADTVGPGDYRGRLRAMALPRLQALIEIVDASARPWGAVTRTS